MGEGRPSSNKLQVALHARPLLTGEEPAGSAITLYPEKNQVKITTANINKTFNCNYVIDGCSSSISDMYKAAVSPLVGTIGCPQSTGLLQGVTNSGRTYTLGFEGGQGLVAYAIRDIYDQIKDTSPHQVTMRVCFVEVYREELFDLLHDVGKPSDTTPSSSSIEASTAAATASGPRMLPLRLVGMTDTVSFDLASQHRVTCPEEVMHLLRCGAEVRRTADNNDNKRSSRSHAILSLTVEQRGVAAAACLGRAEGSGLAEQLSGTLRFVDLAGHEQMSGAPDEKESRSINLDLSALQTVFTQRSQGVHVAYRSSMLTRLVKGDLSGNSHALLIACASLAASCVNKTLHTLQFAEIAGKITNQVRPNRKSLVDVTQDLDLRVEQLQQQVRDLQQQLDTVQRGPAAADGPAAAASSSGRGYQQQYVEAKQQMGWAHEEVESRKQELAEAQQQLLDSQAQIAQARQLQAAAEEAREQLAESQALAAHAQQQLAAAGSETAAAAGSCTEGVSPGAAAASGAAAAGGGSPGSSSSDPAAAGGCKGRGT